jgi:hypothetical protein
MSDEPDDIRAAAVSVYSRYLKDIGSLSLVDLLAEALSFERERCAKIADEYDTGWTRFGPNIAAQIRRGSS